MSKVAKRRIGPPPPNPTDLLRRTTTSKAQLAHEFKGVQPTSALPVAWNGQEGTQQAQVHRAGSRELQMYSDPDRKTCGNCKHFDLEAGRKKMIEERFLERLVREQEWKLRHLGVQNLDELGLCKDRDGTMVTSYAAKACEHYREGK